MQLPVNNNSHVSYQYVRYYIDAQYRRGGRLACMKKSACLVHVLPRSPTKGLTRIQKETMRPAGRIITYMPFVYEMLVVFLGNDV